MSLKEDFDALGGFEAAKKAYLASEFYRDISDTVRRMYPDAIGGKGTIAYIGLTGPSYKSAICFTQFRGICHASARTGDITKHAVIFSHPLISNPKAEHPAEYKEGFLDAFYTWLTTESHVAHVFYEPWNGEFLCVNPFNPISKVLLALIASRTPSERYNTSSEIWEPAVLKHNMPWLQSVLLAGCAYMGGSHWQAQTGGEGAHTPYPLSYLDNKTLKSLLEGKLSDCNTKPYNLNWNDVNASFGGVWQSCNNGKAVTETSKRHKDFVEKVYTALGFKRVKSEWGGMHWESTGAVKSTAKSRDIVIQCFIEEFESVLGE